MADFKLESKFSPAGDQPSAISELSNGLRENSSHQTLLRTEILCFKRKSNFYEKALPPTTRLSKIDILMCCAATSWEIFYRGPS